MNGYVVSNETFRNMYAVCRIYVTTYGRIFINSGLFVIQKKNVFHFNVKICISNLYYPLFVSVG
jgi:hypothetical protein